MPDDSFHSKDNESSDKTSSSKHSKKFEGKKPDFIFIDDTSEYIYGHQEKEQHQWKRKKNPFKQEEFIPRINPVALRALCFFGAILSFIIAIGMLVWIAAVFILAALLLFQHRGLNQILRNLWHFYGNVSTVMMGLAVATLYPAYGIGLIIFYFSFKGDSSSSHTQLIKKMLKNWFK